MIVAPVDRGLFERDFWSIEMAGDSPVISSTSGFCICLKNCRAYAERDSTYRRWPSAKIVSKAKELATKKITNDDLFFGILFVDNSIAYSEYIAENLSDTQAYTNYLAEGLDNTLEAIKSTKLFSRYQSASRAVCMLSSAMSGV